MKFDPVPSFLLPVLNLTYECILQNISVKDKIHVICLMSTFNSYQYLTTSSYKASNDDYFQEFLNLPSRNKLIIHFCKLVNDLYKKLSNISLVIVYVG